MRRVAVIGAGASGLVSIKTCLDEGMVPVCFEKSDYIGGLWHFSDEPRTDPSGPGRVYKELYMNTSKEMSAFSDFPMPKELPPYLMGHHMYQYYQSFAKHFDLARHINLNTEVLAIVEAGDYSQTGRWQVTVREGSGPERTEVFDAVMVCSGVHFTGQVPPYPGLEEFEGEVMHSRQVRKGSDFAGKTVLVVGSGISAGDMSAITSDHANNVYLSVRNGTWIVPRWFGSEPLNNIFNRRWMSWIPPRVFADMLQSKVKALYDPIDLGIQSPKHVKSSHPILNDSVAIKIRNGAIKVKTGIKSFERSKVNFNDGSSVDGVDVVIFATGYDVKFPFFKKDFIQDGYENCELYLQIVPPGLAHPTLTFVGFAVPYIAGQNSVSEMQARYAAKVMKREVKLPAVPEMEKEITTRKDALYAQFGAYYPLWMNPTGYRDFLAREIGALPSLARMFVTDPVLAYNYYFGPAYPPCYRLVGPGAKPNARGAFLQAGANMFYGVTTGTVRGDAMDKLTSQTKKNNLLSSFPLLMIVVFVSILCFTLL